MKKYKIAFGALVTLYLFLNIFFDPDARIAERFQFQQGNIKLLSYTVSVPQTIIWVVAFYGFIKIREYSNSIGDTVDGEGFSRISKGLGILSFGLPLDSLIATLFGYYLADNPQNKDELDFLNLFFFTLITFIFSYYTFKGSKVLANLAKEKENLYRNIFSGIAFFGLIISLVVIYINPNGLTETVNGEERYTSIGLLLATLRGGIQLFGWYMGIMTAVFMSEYGLYVRGIIYKNALKFVVWGLTLIVSSNIVIRILSTFEVDLEGRSLFFIVISINSVLTLLMIGYGFVAYGAKKLKKIEDI